MNHRVFSKLSSVKLIFVFVVLTISLLVYSSNGKKEEREELSKVLNIENIPEGVKISSFNKENLFEYSLTCILICETKGQFNSLLCGRTWKEQEFNASSKTLFNNEKTMKIYLWKNSSAFIEIHLLDTKGSSSIKLGVLYKAKTM